ncbi:MAG: hypothetical protein ACR2JY_10535 [Chloroflexota bacterium]
MPDWLSAPVRGMTYLFLWTLVVAWSISAPIIGILIASNLLMHPAQRIFVPLSIIATIYVTLRGARLLLHLSDRALND